jgi:hypothetical protein
MKRWAWMVVILYGAIILILTLPVIMASFYTMEAPDEGPLVSHFVALAKWAAGILTLWQYWLFILVLLLSAFALLVVPVRIESKLRLSKKSIIFPVIAASLMMGALAAGLVLAIGETIAKDALSDTVLWLALGELILVWILWGFIFFRWSKNLEPKSFIEKQCRYLYRGSILEFLVAVPTHVVARSRDYCCAGFATFGGIVFGIAIMLLSFGPGVFFLYSERWEKLHPQE